MIALYFILCAWSFSEPDLVRQKLATCCSVIIPSFVTEAAEHSRLLFAQSNHHQFADIAYSVRVLSFVFYIPFLLVLIGLATVDRSFLDITEDALSNQIVATFVLVIPAGLFYFCFIDGNLLFDRQGELGMRYNPAIVLLGYSAGVLAAGFLQVYSIFYFINRLNREN